MTSHGHPRSLAVAESAAVAGALFPVAVTAQSLGNGYVTLSSYRYSSANLADRRHRERFCPLTRYVMS
ncbi:hypothetical protein BRC76_08935 [Halobacteriales archaeon QH_8_67_36]|nr:MAG: hypothetical protein BRC76_08935 [Halobacteriales archaeon QH_8_67_36]